MLTAYGAVRHQAALRAGETGMVRRGVRVIGSYGGRVRADVPAILRLVEQDAIAPQRTITRRYALAEAPDAYAALDRGEIIGRAIVVCDQGERSAALHKR